MKWLPVVDFEENYLVSEDGQIKTIATTFRNVKPGRVIKASKIKGGYCMVHLCKDKKNYGLYVHRIVARAFLGECPPKHEVNHKDGNRTNNILSNLEYMTRSENNYHAYRVLGRKAAPTYGIKHHFAKLNPKKAQKARELHKAGQTFAFIGRFLGVHWTSIRSIIRGKTWVIK